MFDRSLIDKSIHVICKFGAIGFFFVSVIGTVILLMDELNLFYKEVPFDGNQLGFILIFSGTFLTIGLTAMGILLHLGTISEEMQISRYLKQKAITNAKNSTDESGN